MTTLTKIGDKAGGASAEALVVPKDRIAITETAAKKVLVLAEREGKVGQTLRIGIQGGGCSGLSYTFAFVAEPEQRDKTFEAFGAKVCIDPKSMLYLGGTVLDWQESLMKSGFALKNPNEVKSCSCGESFSV
jgi:iron-sulfur cluster assembly protein